MQIVAGEPTSEWPGRGWQCQPSVRPGSRRSVRSARTDTARSPRPLDNSHVLGSQSASCWSEGCGLLPWSAVAV